MDSDSLRSPRPVRHRRCFHHVPLIRRRLSEVVDSVEIAITANAGDATALGIPYVLEEALDAIVAGSPRPVDLVRLNDRYFVNVSAGRFLAEVSNAVAPRMKTLTGRLA